MDQFYSILDVRAQTLRQIADSLDERADEYAALMNREMGKLVFEGVAEIQKCAHVCRYYAEHGAEFLMPSENVRYQPLGTILAIMPWNYPFWQAFRVIAPAVMVGNMVWLKHAGVVQGCAVEIEKLCQGLVKSVKVSHDEVEQLIADPAVAAVTLTGSVNAGRTVAQLAAKYLKPCVLELGGSDPFIVFDDADIERAATVAVQSRCLNSGQSCISAKRFLVHESIYDAFLDHFAREMNQAVLAPLVSKSQQRELDSQINDAVKQGANLNGRVLTEVTKSMRVWRDETFGAIAPVVRFADDDEAIRLANDTEYGLGASIWTHDEPRILRFIEELACGMVFINDLVKSDPRFPFGGIKHSGFGRELGREGILSFVNVKTVWRGP